MGAGRILRKTYPFIILKAIFAGLPYAVIMFFLFRVIQAVRALQVDVDSLLSGGDLPFTNEQVTSVGMSVVWLVGAVIGFGILYKILGYIPRYLVRVGHIAVLTHVVQNGEAPPRQLSYGFGTVRRNLGRTFAFYALNRMIMAAINELSMWLRQSMRGWGLIATIISMFKNKFIGYIDECVLAYNFICPEVRPFKASLQGLILYLKNWREMASAAAWTALKVALITLLFNVTFIGLFIWGVFTLNMVMAAVAMVLFVALGVFKRCFLDTFAMVNMLEVFISRVDNTQPLMMGDLMKYSSVSPEFRNLIISADQSEGLFTDAERQQLYQVNQMQGMHGGRFGGGW